MRIVRASQERDKSRIYNIRKYLIEKLKSYDGIVSFDEFTKDELNEILFDYCNDGRSKRFALPRDICKKIDMSNVSFDNFEAVNFDFSDLVGVRINPNNLYLLEIKNVDFSNVTFLDEFRNCTVIKTNFQGNAGTIIDGKHVEGAIFAGGMRYGGGNEFADVTFTEPINNVINGSISGTDFTGSKGAVIELGLGKVNILKDCYLKDATLSGTFRNCYIEGANFKGAHGSNGGSVRINPNILAFGHLEQRYVRVLDGCCFDGVEFIEDTTSHGWFSICNTDFSGSKGFVISPYNVFKRNYEASVFKGVKFTTDPITDANLTEANFEGSEGAIIEGPQASIALANLTDVSLKFADPFEFCFSLRGAQTATCEGRSFLDVFNDAVANFSENEPTKVYTKIDRAINKDKK